MLGRYSRSRVYNQHQSNLPTRLQDDDVQIEVVEDDPNREPSVRSDVIDAKIRIHRNLINELNLAVIEGLSRGELRNHIFEFVNESVRRDRLLLNQKELADFVDEIIDELTGLGPIEPLLKDDTVTDILVNTHQHIFVERRGRLERVPARFQDEAHVLRIISKIVSAVGRQIDESQPLVDARLADGSRINVAIRPAAVDGPLISIRKFARDKIDINKLVEFGTLPAEIADFLGSCVRAKISILISGGTGSGKTTLMNALSAYIPDHERLITIEDAAELQLQQPHVGRLETCPPTIDGRGEIRQRELVKNALRMRPDRIIVGEVRGEEAFDMLQAMTTGHEGSLTTIHANTARDSLVRLEHMINMLGFSMSETGIRTHISSAIGLVVQLQRMIDGKRRIVSVSEVTGQERDVIQMQEIFKFIHQKTVSAGEVIGEFRPTGITPNFLDQLRVSGIETSNALFDPNKVF